MAIRTILHYPDPRLREVAEPVDEVTDEIKKLAEDLAETMYAAPGVGLAAPQVGLRKRILVLNPTGKAEDDLVLVNPTIVERSGSPTVMEEGCLSFPGIYAEIERPENCTVRAFDPKGEPLEAEYGGFVSRIIQHEYDHLEGILLVDRMSPGDKLRNKAALEELIDRYKAARQGSP